MQMLYPINTIAPLFLETIFVIMKCIVRSIEESLFRSRTLPQCAASFKIICILYLELNSAFVPMDKWIETRRAFLSSCSALHLPTSISLQLYSI